MAPARRDLAVYRGDVYTHKLTFQNDASPPAPLDVSGYTFTARIRESAMLAVDATQAAAGIIILSLTEAETAALGATLYSWDLQVEPIGQTWLAGKVSVSGDATRV